MTGEIRKININHVYRTIFNPRPFYVYSTTKKHYENKNMNHYKELYRKHSRVVWEKLKYLRISLLC